jgi:hypothetical protein
MQILARYSVAAGLAAMSAVGAWLLVHRSEDAGAPQLVPPPIDDEPLTAIAKDSAPPEEPAVIVEDVDGPTWMPPGYVDDVSRDKTEELAALVQDWLTSPTGSSPVIEFKRGILYIESDEDRGDDGPYPTSAQAEGRRVCGSDAIWMREYIRQRYQNDSVSCAGNVCTIGGMEYAPTSSLVFKEIGPDEDRRWALIAWTQVYEAALVQDVVDANYRTVIASMIRLRDTRCSGEPAGFYY